MIKDFSKNQSYYLISKLYFYPQNYHNVSNGLTSSEDITDFLLELLIHLTNTLCAIKVHCCFEAQMA
jgi:hypothetical protein